MSSNEDNEDATSIIDSNEQIINENNSNINNNNPTNNQLDQNESTNNLSKPQTLQNSIPNNQSFEHQNLQLKNMMNLGSDDLNISNLQLNNSSLQETQFMNNRNENRQSQKKQVRYTHQIFDDNRSEISHNPLPLPSNPLPSKDSNENAPKKWDDDFEKICANLIDEAQINTYLHMKSHRYFTKWSKRFQIPIIILSAVAGSGNFVSSTFGEYERLGIVLIGIVSIFTSILSSIAQYLQLAELKEGHRISSFHWEKFFNELKVQLMLKRECRKVMPEFYNNLLIEYQRLKEISPIFRKKISRAARKKEGYEYMNVPFYLNGFRPIVPYEKSVEDYQYYYMVNNSDKWIGNKDSKSKTVRKKRARTTSSIDPDLTNSGFWNDKNRRTSNV